ncbi:hypothetical protein GHK79_11395 [Enterococcus faecium]|uniref:hypothetical protein n=1 Tax=Enterococcus faecium TaxID=1352 RepID=UPI0019226F24|nr:hypothetical protein [Enterococcus faecium]MBL3708421.1 hypothetical protein [Enterococcus faecium]
MNGNIFREASRRYRNFKARGFITKEGNINGRDIYQSFIKEVAAEKSGNSFDNPWGRKAYEKLLDTNIDYLSTERFEELQAKKLEKDRQKKYKKVVAKYKDEIKSELDIGGFYEMLEKYGTSKTGGFDPYLLDSLETLEELIDFCRAADNIEVFMFRKARGRNRREESDMLPQYKNELSMNLKILTNEMSVLKYELS